MSKKKKVLQFTPAPKCINLIRYTKEAWLRCYPGSNEEEWKEEQLPYCNSDYVYGYLDMFTEKSGCRVDDIEKTRIIVLDEEYFDYLEKTGKENTPQTRAAYDLPDDKAKELFEKYHFDRDYHLMLLPVTIIMDKGEYEFRLSQGTVKGFREYLARVYGKENVWFPGFITNDRTIDLDHDRIFRIGAAYFEEGKKITLGSLSMCAIQSGDTAVIRLFIPFIIKGSFSRYILKKGDPDGWWRVNSPDAHSFDFLGAGITAMLEKNFGAIAVETADHIIFYDEIEDYWEEIYENMEAMLDE